jgi:hypothetical protein
LRSYKSPFADHIPAELIKQKVKIYVLWYINYLFYTE